MPHFTLELTSACRLTIKPQHANNAYVSLLQVGEADPGQPIIPRATDSVVAINEAVTNKMGYYYLKATRCPQVYQGTIKGAKLLAAGAAARTRARACVAHWGVRVRARACWRRRGACVGQQLWQEQQWRRGQLHWHASCRAAPPQTCAIKPLAAAA